MQELSSADVADKRNIAWALEYADKGWRIFPAPPDAKKSFKSEKHSGAKWGMTRDATEITADFTRWPHARIGVPTGPENNLVIIDVDTVEGHGVDGSIGFKGLEENLGPLPRTLQAISPSRSIHHYLEHPGRGIKIVTKAAIAPGVDCKGNGGMVIAPGSVNPDGRSYRWLNDLPIAPLPEAWVNFLKYNRPTIRERAAAAVNAHRVARMVQCGGANRYADAALTPTCITKTLWTSTAGQHRHRMWWLWCRQSGMSVKTGHRIGSASCPLYPQKRTSLNVIAMSAWCHKQTSV